MTTYYINLSKGKPSNDGLSQESPKSSVKNLSRTKEDTVIVISGCSPRTPVSQVRNSKG